MRFDKYAGPIALPPAYNATPEGGDALLAGWGSPFVRFVYLKNIYLKFNFRVAVYHLKSSKRYTLQSSAMTIVSRFIFSLDQLIDVTTYVLECQMVAKDSAM